MRWASMAMAGVFALAVVVQWNDPDPVMWMLLYGSASAVSLAAGAGSYFPRPTLALAVMYSAGAIWTFPAVLSSSLSAYTSFKMRSTGDEVARECVGLILCAAWMFVLWRRGRPATRR